MDLWGFITFVVICFALQTGSHSLKIVNGIEGDDVSLPCPDTANKTEVNWTSPADEKLTHGEKVFDDRFEVFHPKASWYLRIVNVSFADAGKYTCVVKDNGEHHEVELILKEPRTGTASSDTKSTTSTTTTEDPSKCSVTQPCENSGFCENGICTCPRNFTGMFCQLSPVCDIGVYCNINNTVNCTRGLINGGVETQCNCLPFYRGNRCEIHDLCQSYPCRNRGKCILNYPDEGYKCQCKLHGDPNNDCKLNEVDDCARNPPSGTSSFITCTDLIESRILYCSPGHVGNGCSRKEDHALYCHRNGPGYCADEGYCKPFCNVDICNGTKNCNFTTVPFNTNVLNGQTNCLRSFGDGYEDADCKNESALFDGFDAKLNGLRDCSPFFNTTCTINFDNNDCNSGCDTEECLWDGYDCESDKRPEKELTGVVIVELKGSLENPLKEIQKNISLMLRSMVNITEEDTSNKTDSILSLKIKEGVFTEVSFAGKFLAAAVAKRPGWLDRVKIKDIYVCSAGTYGHKCERNCSTCNQIEDICDWRNGECLYGCPKAHRGQFCEPCDMCNPEGEVCDPMTGDCLHGCKPGYWGTNCTPCSSSCKQEGSVCNNDTGECLHGCTSNNFFTSMCIQCPQNCAGGCNDKGQCNDCSVGTFGDTCARACDNNCHNGKCDRDMGHCQCQANYYWSTMANKCKICSDGCKDICDGTTGNCKCKDGFYNKMCDLMCNKRCLNGNCHMNGTCVNGCSPGFHGFTCSEACPSGCDECARNTGLCMGQCKAGYEGSNCEKLSQTGNMDDATDNTGIIIGVIISLLLVCLILVVACCYWKRRQSGDYVMEDEEMEEPLQKDNSNAISVHINSHMQPSSPLLGHSTDMIELDEKQSFAVYAGPSRESTENKTPNGNGPEVKNAEEKDGNESGDNMDDTADTTDGKADDSGKKERCTSSVKMEIGKGGRVLSVSDADETQSPTLTKEVDVPIGEESVEDDSAFDDPPHSPLGEVRAPLASEENILASLGPKEMETDDADKPVDLEAESKDKGSKKSRSSSSSSSSSKSSKSSSEKTTEM